MQQSKLEICKGQSKMSWGTTGKNCAQHQLPWLAHSPFPSLCHPRLTLTNIWEKRSWIFLFSLLLGLLLHSVLPLFIKVPKNTTLAEPGMWRMTRGAQVLQLHHPASISSSSAQLSLIGNGNQAPNSGPRVLYTTPPNAADHPQPKPTSNSHIFKNFIQNHLGSVPAGREARLSASIVPTRVCWAELNPELREKPIQNPVATALKERNANKVSNGAHGLLHISFPFCMKSFGSADSMSSG